MKELNIALLYKAITGIAFATEDLVKVSDLDYARVMLELKMRLREVEYKVICSRFGLGESDDLLTLAEIGREIGLTAERVRQIQCRAISKLARYNKLPSLFGYFYMPDDPDAIEHLRLSARTQACLKRAGIATITGIKDFNGDWHKIRNLGRGATDEINERLMLAGYQFQIRS